MYRLCAPLLAALVLVSAGCKRRAREPDPAPGGNAVEPKPTVVPAPDPRVAPMPHEARLNLAPMPHEKDLTKTDVGLEPTIESSLPEVPRPGVPGKIDPTAPPVVVPPPPGGLDPAPGGAGAAGPGPKADPKDEPKDELDLDPKLSVYAGRKGPTKEKLLKHYGGTAETEKAVLHGLAWLAHEQKKDGNWVFDAGGFRQETTAATGLALLAYLGAGETHKDAKAKYQKVVASGLAFLMKSCATGGANAGRFSTQMYSQGIATLALCEAYAMTNDATLRPYAQAALIYIQRAQAKNGSWGYSLGATGDTSITGWQLQALFAGKQGKLVVDNKVLKNAFTFLDSVAPGERKAVYGYADKNTAKPGTALTASGLWSRHILDNWGPKHEGLADGATGLLKRPPAKAFDLYYLHYATQVLRAVEGDEWKTWNEGPKAADGTRKDGLRDTLLAAQVTKDGATQGSWNPDAGYFGTSCGRLGTTAASVIVLESYYRHLPLYRAGDPKMPPKK